MNQLNRLMVYIILSVAFFNNASGKVVLDDEFIISAEFDKKEYYCNEVGMLVVWLYSTTPDLAGFEEVEPVSLNQGEFSYIAKVNEMPRAHRKKYKNKEYYAFPLAVYATTLKSPGNYSVNAGSYRVGINEQVIVRDPFFGAVRRNKTEMKDVVGSNTSVKIKKLPDVKGESSFTGAVGDYKISVEVPKGDIIINEAATAIITVEGEGLIGDDTMPDYHDAFRIGCKLKSVKESNDYLYNGRSIISRKILECEFIPTDIDKCEISPVEFSFFNPHSGKYDSVSSEPLTVDVKSSTVRITPFEI